MKMSSQPASGMITSLGSGIAALSIVMARKTPNQPTLPYRLRQKSMMLFSIPRGTEYPFSEARLGLL